FSVPLAPRSRPWPGSFGHESDRRSVVWAGPARSPPGGSREQGGGQRGRQVGHLAGARAAAWGRDHVLQAVLGGLLETTLGVTDPAQLAGQAQLSEACPRCAADGRSAAR